MTHASSRIDEAHWSGYSCKTTVMTPDQYVESVLAKYAVPRGPTSSEEVIEDESHAGP